MTARQDVVTVIRLVPLGRLKVGDVLHWTAAPFGGVWLAERGAGDAGGAE